MTSGTGSHAPGTSGMLPALAAGVTVVLWASAFLAIRVLGDTFSPGSMAFLRLAAAVLPLTVILLLTRRHLARSRVGESRSWFPRGRALWLVLAYGVAWFAGYTVLLNWSEQRVDAGTAALLVNLAPIMVAVYAGFFMGEGFPRPLVIGMVLAFTGVVLIAVGGSTADDAHADGVGVLLGVGAAVLYALGVVLQKSALHTVDAVTATWLGATAGLVATVPFAPTALAELADASAADIASVVYLGVGPTAIAFTTWAYALARTSAGAMAATTLVVPAIVILASWALLAELPTALGILGGILAIVGVAIARNLIRCGRRATDVP